MRFFEKWGVALLVEDKSRIAHASKAMTDGVTWRVWILCKEGMWKGGTNGEVGFWSEDRSPFPHVPYGGLVPCPKCKQILGVK